MSDWPSTIGLHVLTSLIDSRYQSVGEVRAAYLFWREGLPRFEPQYDVYREDGSLAGTVDFAWPEHGVIVEFDGREKYLRYRKPGESVADAVLRERERENEIHELTGWTVIRITWADLARPAETAARILRFLRTVRTTR